MNQQLFKQVAQDLMQRIRTTAVAFGRVPPTAFIISSEDPATHKPFASPTITPVVGQGDDLRPFWKKLQTLARGSHAEAVAAAVSGLAAQATDAPLEGRLFFVMQDRERRVSFVAPVTRVDQADPTSRILAVGDFVPGVVEGEMQDSLM